MDLQQIRYFLALANTLNFTRAADLCNVTQPALTKSIKRLEIELGGDLLLRERAHTQLTELGVAMLPLLQQTFDAAETARTNARHFHKRDRQRLRIALGTAVEPGLVLPLIQAVRQRFTQLEIILRGGEPAELNRWLLESETDIVLTMHPAELTERANRWVVFSDPVVALMHGPCATPEPVGAGALGDESIVGRSDETARSVEAHYGLSGVIRHRGDTEEHVQMLVRAGMGIGLSTASRKAPADLVHRTIDPSHAIEVCVAAIAGRPLSRAADSFLRLARAREWNEAPP